MKTTLLNYTPLNIISTIILVETASLDQSDTNKTWEKYEKDLIAFNSKESKRHPGHKVEVGPKDRALITNHISNHLDQLIYTFKIENISDNLLNKLSDYCTITFKNNRFTIRDIKQENSFVTIIGEDVKYDKDGMDRANKYIVFTGNESVDKKNILVLENIRQLTNDSISNEYLSYLLPKAIMSDIVITITANKLKELLSVAEFGWEKRKFDRVILASIPDEHQYIFNNLNKIS